MSERTILVIDGDPESVERARGPLVDAGYRVEIARDGQEGLQSFLALRPDLVLLEAMLPKTHGLEVCEQIKNGPHGPRTSVLMTAADPGEGRFMAQARKIYHYDHYLPKPVDSAELLECCRRLLDESAAAAPGPPSPAALCKVPRVRDEQEIVAQLETEIATVPTTAIEAPVVVVTRRTSRSSASLLLAAGVIVGIGAALMVPAIRRAVADRSADPAIGPPAARPAVVVTDVQVPGGQPAPDDTAAPDAATLSSSSDASSVGNPDESSTRPAAAERTPQASVAQQQPTQAAEAPTPAPQPAEAPTRIHAPAVDARVAIGSEQAAGPDGTGDPVFEAAEYEPSTGPADPEPRPAASGEVLPGVSIEIAAGPRIPPAAAPKPAQPLGLDVTPRNPDPTPDPTPSNPPAQPAPLARPGQLLGLGEVDLAPRAISRRSPSYHPTARRLGQQGTVTMNLLIDENGRVIKTELLNGIPGSLLNGMALRAAKRWKYEPAMKDGVAVMVWKPETIAYKLSD